MVPGDNHMKTKQKSDVAQWCLCQGVEDFLHHTPECSGELQQSTGARILHGRPFERGVLEPRSPECHKAYVEWKRNKPY